MVTYICKKRKVIFSHLPKCGCESIRYLLLAEDNLFKWNADIWSSKMGIYLKQRFEECINNNFRYITICRNPYERLVSGYIDKFCSPSFFQLPFCKKVMKFYGRDNINNYPERITFTELVLYLAKNSQSMFDDHFKPQTKMIIKHPKNKIIKLEDKEKIDETIKELGFKTEFINYNKVILKQNTKKVNVSDNINVFEQGYQFFKNLQNKNQVPKYNLFYNDVIKDVVYNIYKKDFETFGYPNDL